MKLVKIIRDGLLKEELLLKPIVLLFAVLSNNSQMLASRFVLSHSLVLVFVRNQSTSQK
jgi:ABC-type uncharacterized transport system permease subunit